MAVWYYTFIKLGSNFMIVGLDTSYAFNAIAFPAHARWLRRSWKHMEVSSRELPLALSSAEEEEEEEKEPGISSQPASKGPRISQARSSLDISRFI